MKIIHIISGLNNGGAEAVLNRLIMDDDQNEHHVISMMDLGFYGSGLISAGHSVYTLGMNQGKIKLSSFIKLYNLIKSIEPDLTQTWMYHADLIGGIISKIAGYSNVVWGVHHFSLNSKNTKTSTLIIAKLSAWFSYLIPKKIICCSDASLNVHVNFGYKASIMVSIPNGVDPTIFFPNPNARKEKRLELGLGQDEVIFGMIARWNSQKDHKNLISALKILVDKNIFKWKCVLVGPQITFENQELKLLIEKNGLTKHLLLIGPRNDIPNILNAFDIHILSSSAEAFGNVTIEAMCCSIPCIVTAVGASEYIVDDTGWIVEPKNSMKLSNSIYSAMLEISNHKIWDKRKGKARLRAMNFFALEKMINKYNEVWVNLPQN
jgi:glycosyltransferase involved in cell wall biosynthesis